MNRAKKVANNEGYEKFKPLAKSICTEFRITMERIVEDYLLNAIVRRYRRSITTQNRLDALVKINQTDVDLIDAMMTKYSIFEHSQSSELPTNQLNADEILADLFQIRDWIKEFKGR